MNKTQGKLGEVPLQASLLAPQACKDPIPHASARSRLYRGTAEVDAILRRLAASWQNDGSHSPSNAHLELCFDCLLLAAGAFEGPQFTLEGSRCELTFSAKDGLSLNSLCLYSPPNGPLNPEPSRSLGTQAHDEGTLVAGGERLPSRIALAVLTIPSTCACVLQRVHTTPGFPIELSLARKKLPQLVQGVTLKVTQTSRKHIIMRGASFREKLPSHKNSFLLQRKPAMLNHIL